MDRFPKFSNCTCPCCSQCQSFKVGNMEDLGMSVPEKPFKTSGTKADDMVYKKNSLSYTICTGYTVISLYLHILFYEL